MTSVSLAYRLVDPKNEEDFLSNGLDYNENDFMHLQDRTSLEKHIYLPCPSKSRHYLCPFLINGLARRDTGFLRFGRK